MSIYSKKELSNVEFEGIDHGDAPDYCDSYIVRAVYKGLDLTEEELEELNEDDDLKFQLLEDWLY